MSPFPTPCKGKSKSQPFAHTFALTGRRRFSIDTQGVALGYEQVALLGRSFSRFVRLSCAHASPLVVWQKNAQIFFWILNTLPAAPVFQALFWLLRRGRKQPFHLRSEPLSRPFLRLRK